jgi:predicted dehydrogenase
MTERVRVALIGAGRIGQRHAATLGSAIPAAELALIADVQGAAAEALAARVRCERWSNDDRCRGDRLLDRQPRAADRRRRRSREVDLL